MAQLEAELSVDEFSEWIEYFKLESELRKKAMDKAKAEGRAKKGR